MTITREEAYAESFKYFGEELPANVFIDKYALRDKDNNLLEKSPEDMHKRLAKEFTRIELNYANLHESEEQGLYEHILESLSGFKRIVPQGGIMSGAGDNNRYQSLSNCFVVDAPKDSYESILRVDTEMIELEKRRGGVGTDLSNIRPNGSKVSNAARTSTGVVPFMERYSNSTREVAQGGRRGALMLSIDVNHNDVENFIDAKMEDGKVTGANISVRVDDKFMQDVIAEYIPGQKPDFYAEVDHKKRLWDKIIYNAWKSAEPGVLFWDTIKKESPADCYEEEGYGTVSTNPCGEIPLCPYDSCRLLAINLYAYVDNPFTPYATFNYERFGKDVELAQRYMDDVVDLELEKIRKIQEKIESDPEPEEDKKIARALWKKIYYKAESGRRTGLGVTAEGDMVAAMGLTYGTKEATDFSVSVHKAMAVHSYASSIKMAKERGAFPIWNYEKEKDNPFINRVLEAATEVLGVDKAKEIVAMYKETGRRNIATLTIAPTGSTSLLTKTSSGIEPVFLPVYIRSKKQTVEPDSEVAFIDSVGDKWVEFPVVHDKLKEFAKINTMSTDDWNEVYKNSPYWGATSNDVNWKEKVRMQGEIQKWVDHSINTFVA